MKMVSVSFMDKEATYRCQPFQVSGVGKPARGAREGGNGG